MPADTNTMTTAPPPAPPPPPMRTRASPKEFRCNICDRRVPSREALIMHTRGHERPAKTHRCARPGCTYSGTSRGSLQTHMAMHTLPQKRAVNAHATFRTARRPLATINVAAAAAAAAASEANTDVGAPSQPDPVTTPPLPAAPVESAAPAEDDATTVGDDSLGSADSFGEPADALDEADAVSDTIDLSALVQRLRSASMQADTRATALFARATTLYTLAASLAAAATDAAAAATLHA